MQIENLNGGQILLPWVLNPDLSGESVALRESPATRGVDNVNNLERISQEIPTTGTYKITVTHSGGIAGSLPATLQEVSVVSTNAEPQAPEFTSIEVSPAQNEFILSYESDPGAFYDIETSTDLVTWASAGTTFAEDSSNVIFVSTGQNDSTRFWRLRRSQ